MNCAQRAWTQAARINAASSAPNDRLPAITRSSGIASSSAAAGQARSSAAADGLPPRVSGVHGGGAHGAASHHGAYEGLPAAEKKLRAYARRHGLTPTGKLRRIYLEGPPQHKDPAKFVTQVALPLEEE